MKKQFEQHKRKDRIKWCITAFALFFVILTVVGMGLQLFGNGKVKPSEWFKKDEITQTTSDNNETKTAAVYTSAFYSMETTAATNVAPRSINYSLPDWWDSEKPSAYSYDNYGISSNIGEISDFYGSVEIRFHTTGYGDGYGANFAILFTAPNFDYYVVENISVDIYECSCDYAFLCESRVDYNAMGIYANNQYCEIVPCDYRDTFKHSFVCSPLGNNKFTSGEFYVPYEFADDPGGGSYYLPGFHYLFDIQYKLEKDPIPLPSAPVKEGHTFVGWYYDSAFTRPYGGELIFDDTNLYAKYEINRYTVTFNSNGGNSVESQTVDWGTAANVPELTLDGYTFLGWFLPDGTQYTNQPIKQDTELTAHW